MNITFELISWYKIHKKELPWRKTKDPYSIWICEIILQQTRVNQGLGYYERFINSFSNVEKLALAQEAEVLKLWQGLGYYSRARNIHFSAKTIYSTLNSVFPTTFNEIIKLKGIGKYTAAAIASIAFNEPVAAIDGNAFRVYARLYAIDLDITKTTTFNYFFSLANKHIDKNNPGDFNQAIMDLGSTICLPKNPICINCPLNKKCKAYAEDLVAVFPVKSKKAKAKKEKLNYLLILDNGNNFILKKRDASSIWANMFDLPEIFTEENKRNEIEELLGSNEINLLLTRIHLLTHKRLEISFYCTIISDISFYEKLLEDNKYIKINKTNLYKYALPKPIEFLLEQDVFL